VTWAILYLGLHQIDGSVSNPSILYVRRHTFDRSQPDLVQVVLYLHISAGWSLGVWRRRIGGHWHTLTGGFAPIDVVNA